MATYDLLKTWPVFWCTGQTHIKEVFLAVLKTHLVYLSAQQWKNKINKKYNYYLLLFAMYLLQYTLWVDLWTYNKGGVLYT